MAYYHILKKRRLDLNLSVQDIAIQTHLVPEYIRAIEEHNLDVFSDDFSFVRYFTHAYCDAIGVNWQVIAPEVDADISMYARAKDQALTQAQRRMVQNMPSSRKRNKKRIKVVSKLHKLFAGSAGRLSRSLNWDSKNRLTKSLIIGGALLIVFLIALNTITDSLAARSQANLKAQKEQELMAKEEETQRLAKQLQAQKDASGENKLNIQLTPVPNQENHFYITGGISAEKKNKLVFTMTSPSHVEILAGGNAIMNQELDSEYTFDLSIDKEQDVEIKYTSFADGDYLKVNDTAIPINGAAFENGAGSVWLSFVDQVPEDASHPQTNDEQQAESTEQPEGEVQEQSEQTADTNLIYDESVGMYYDSTNGLYIDSSTGQYLDPNTMQPFADETADEQQSLDTGYGE